MAKDDLGIENMKEENKIIPIQKKLAN